MIDSIKRGIAQHLHEAGFYTDRDYMPTDYGLVIRICGRYQVMLRFHSEYCRLTNDSVHFGVSIFEYTDPTFLDQLVSELNRQRTRSSHVLHRS